MENGYVRALDEYFAAQYSDYVKLSALDGYVMPEVVFVGADGNIDRRDSQIMRLCHQKNCGELLKKFKAGLADVDFTFHFAFRSFRDKTRDPFRKYTFAKLLPAGGTLVINGDIPHVEQITDSLSCEVVTFGTSSCDYVPSNITYDEFGHPSFDLKGPDGKTRSYALRVPGLYNVYNAAAAVATAELLGIDAQIIREALSDFKGTDRRFEYKGQMNGITIIDDYAHHPTEITATLHAAQNYPHKTIWCVFQPHTYSRTKAFLPEFAEALSIADKIVLADIFAAREKDTLGISSETLRKEIENRGHECYYFPTFAEIENFLIENCTKGDLLITMGAGDVVKIGENLLRK